MMKIPKLIIVLIPLFFGSCSDLFDYSPYQANVDDALKNQTNKNVGNLVIESTKSTGSFSFVTIADSHYKFNELRKAINKINTLKDIDFVVHLGDMTDRGLLMEYEMFSTEIDRLKIPIFTCIGNHDYLSNGGAIYKQMFGKYNYSIYYKNTKLVFFDATTFESSKKPDMEWFASQLADDDTPKIIFSHIPPWDDQYYESNTMLYKKLVDNENVIVSMHGHHHEFSDTNPMNTETPFLIPGDIDDARFCKVTIDADHNYTYEFLSF